MCVWGETRDKTMYQFNQKSYKSDTAATAADTDDNDELKLINNWIFYPWLNFNCVPFFVRVCMCR